MMSEKARQLRLGIPKGSLQETTQKLFIRAGYGRRISGRSYYPYIDDPEIECILIRPQEMARYVGQGILDCAITGLDWILETDADVADIADLRAPWPNYGPVRWVMASKDDSPFHLSLIHISEPTRLGMISYAVFCLKKKKKNMKKTKLYNRTTYTNNTKNNTKQGQ